MKCYNIKYIKHTKELIATCSEYSLNMIKKDIEDMGGSILSIEVKRPLKAKKENDPVITEKNKYYASMYNLFYKKYKNKKISMQLFNEIKEKLRELKNKVNNKTEFQEIFEEYLKDKDIKG